MRRRLRLIEMLIEVSSIHTNFITDLSILGPTLYFRIGSPDRIPLGRENMKHCIHMASPNLTNSPFLLAKFWSYSESLAPQPHQGFYCVQIFDFNRNILRKLLCHIFPYQVASIDIYSVLHLLLPRPRSTLR